MITRELLITTIYDPSAKREYELVGRYDAVAVAHAGHIIKSAEFRKYACKEEDFIKISKEVKR